MRALIGREREQARLRALLARVDEGRGGAAVIRGEAGIGKSALARWMQAEARDAGAVVLEGRAHPHGAMVSYGPVVEAFGRALRTLRPDELTDLTARIVGLSVLFGGLVDEPDLPPLPEELLLTRTLEALRALLVHMAAARPVLLVLDDLQWADPASLRVLSHLAGELEAAPIALVATLRDGDDARRPDVRSTLASLRRMTDVDEIRPARLDTTEVATLLTQLTGQDPDPEVVAEVAARSAGTPLFVEVLGRNATAGGRATQEAPTEAPDLIHDIVAERLVGLDDHAMAVLATVSVAPAATSVADVQRVVELDDAAFDTSLGELAHRELVSVDASSGEIEASHPLVAEVVESDIPPRARAATHARFVEVLGDDADPELRAAHLSGAGDAVDPDVALAVLCAAADQAAGRQAHRSAVSYAGRALDRAIASDRRAEEISLRVQLGTSLLALGEGASSEAVLTEGLDRPALDVVDRLAILVPLELVRFARGAGPERLADLDAALDAVPDEDLRPEVLVALEQRITAHARRGEQPEAVAAAVDASRRTGDSDRLDVRCVHRICLAYLAWFDDEHRLHERLTDAEEVAHEVGAAHWLQRVQLMQLDAALMAGPVDLARRRAAAVGGADSGLQTWRDRVVDHVCGLAELDPGWAEPETTDQLAGWEAPLRVVDAVLASHRAWVTRDRDLALAAHAMWDELTTDGRLGAARTARWVTGAALALVEGDAPTLARLAATAPALLPRSADELIVDELIGHVGLAAGTPELAGAVVGRLARFDGWAAALSLHLDAVAAGLGGDRDRACTLARRAAECFESVGDRHHRAEALTVAAEAGDRDAAALLPPLLDAVERAGIDALADRMRAAAGVGSRPTGSAPVLTPRQLEIAELVAEGLSNAAIADRLTVSVRTVTSHLDHIYTRLGIGNRTELAVRVPTLRATSDVRRSSG